MVSKRHVPQLTGVVGRTSRPLDTMKVIMTCLGHLERDEITIAASRVEIARACRITSQDVSTVMGELAAVGVVCIRRVGRRTVYGLNPSVAWAGREAARTAAAREFDPAKAG